MLVLATEVVAVSDICAAVATLGRVSYQSSRQPTPKYDAFLHIVLFSYFLKIELYNFLTLKNYGRTLFN
jgi:hypothetical protein